jgi:chorismate mutase / prephenate dehydrogenase
MANLLITTRKKVDSIDPKILKLVAKRLSLMPAVARYKMANKIAFRQTAREKELLADRRKLARKLGISPKLAEDLFKRIIKDSYELQLKTMKKRKNR